MSKELVFGEWHVIAAPREPQRRLAPVHACIYCGQTDSLTDEHIIPDGIGGDLILPDASCRVCQRKIKPWEQRVQKRNLGATRAAVGVKSRKRRGRKKPEEKRLYRAVPICVDDQPIGADRGPEITDSADLPYMVLAEITKGRPELLGGPIPGNGLCMAYSHRKGVGAQEYTIDFWSFGGDYIRLIAKIAHGLAVATLGLDEFEPFLTDIILQHDHPTEDFWKYVGGGLASGFREELHRVRVVGMVASIRSETGLGTRIAPVVVVHIQLFANCGAPLYEVVVGRKRTYPKIALYQKGSDA